MNRLGRFGWLVLSMSIMVAFTAQVVSAKEYADPVQGFSISYPDHFIPGKSEIPEIFFVTDPANYPWLTAGVLQAADFPGAVQAHMKGWSSGLEINPVRGTVTQDGTKASLVEIAYVVKGYNAKGLALGIQNGEKWAIASFTTTPPWGQYDEGEFLKILKTLKYKK